MTGEEDFWKNGERPLRPEKGKKRICCWKQGTPACLMEKGTCCTYTLQALERVEGKALMNAGKLKGIEGARKDMDTSHGEAAPRLLRTHEEIKVKERLEGEKKGDEVPATRGKQQNLTEDVLPRGGKVRALEKEASLRRGAKKDKK